MSGSEQVVETTDTSGASTTVVAQEPPELERAVRATALGRGTHGVPELRLLVEGALARAFPHRVWLAGRVGDVVLEPSVGMHFVLRAAQDDDEPLVLACLLSGEALPAVADVLDRVHDADLVDVVAEGRLARVGGLLRYDTSRSTLVFTVSEIDPTPTLRGLEERREAVRAGVVAQGLGRRQRERPQRSAPLVVALVGQTDDNEVQSVREALRRSPYAVDVRCRTVDLHGPAAPALVAAAVHEGGMTSDVVLVVRAPGRPLTLAVFDAPEVLSAVEEALAPVVVALGGEGTATAADDVAAVSLPDGDAASRWLLDRLAAAEGALRRLHEEVEQAALEAGDRARGELAGLRDEVERAVEEAEVRAVAAQRRRRLRLAAVTAFVVVAVALAAVLLGDPWVLLGLGAVVLLLLAVQLWTAWRRRRGSRTMSQQDEDFAAVLSGLRSARDELGATSSPETVHRLRERAMELLARGEAVLRGQLPPTRVADGRAAVAQERVGQPVG